MNISKKTTIILILGLSLLLIGVVLYFYFSPEDKKPPEDTRPTSNFGDTSTEATNNDQDITPEEETPTEQEEDNKQVTTLRKIFNEPNSGSVIFTRNKETFVRFVERSNGNMFETKKDSTQLVRLTNKTIPKIQEVLWDKGAESLIFRYLNESENGDQIESFSGKIKISASTTNEFLGDISGSFLPVNLESIDVSPSSEKIVYLQDKINSDNSYIYISNMNGTARTQIAEIPLSQVLLSWPKSNTIAVMTKPSFRYPGFLYFINTNDGILRKVIGGSLGLSTIVNQQASGVLYSKINNKAEPSLNYYNLSEGSDTNIGLKTFAEKCVFGKKDPASAYCAVPKNITSKGLPDNWYQGKISFEDDIWKIDATSGKATLIYDSSSEGEKMDIINISINDTDNYLVFTNKKDLSLWGLKID